MRACCPSWARNSNFISQNARFASLDGQRREYQIHALTLAVHWDATFWASRTVRGLFREVFFVSSFAAGAEAGSGEGDEERLGGLPPRGCHSAGGRPPQRARSARLPDPIRQSALGAVGLVEGRGAVAAEPARGVLSGRQPAS